MPQLPALQLDPRNALLDLTPVNNALMGIQRQQNANRDYAMQQDELAMRKQSHASQENQRQRQWARQDVEDMGKRAMAVDAMADGPQKQAIWQRIVQRRSCVGARKTKSVRPSHPNTVTRRNECPRPFQRHRRLLART